MGVRGPLEDWTCGPGRSRRENPSLREGPTVFLVEKIESPGIELLEVAADPIGNSDDPVVADVSVFAVPSSFDLFRLVPRVVALSHLLESLYSK